MKRRVSASYPACGTSCSATCDLPPATSAVLCCERSSAASRSAASPLRANPTKYPASLHRFLSRYLRYDVSVYAFLHVIANPFPGFAGAEGA